MKVEEKKNNKILGQGEVDSEIIFANSMVKKLFKKFTVCAARLICNRLSLIVMKTLTFVEMH